MLIKSHNDSTTSTSPLISFIYSFGNPRALHSFPTRRSSDLHFDSETGRIERGARAPRSAHRWRQASLAGGHASGARRSEEHTSELQSQSNLVCRLLLEKKNISTISTLRSSFPPGSIPYAYNV